MKTFLSICKNSKKLLQSAILDEYSRKSFVYNRLAIRLDI